MAINLKVYRWISISKALILFVFGISLSSFFLYSQAQTVPGPKFNHDSTSFQLQGAHRVLDCKQCHSGGRYKGTPRTCEDCHNGQISYGKPSSHLMTTQTCTLCHTQNAWIPSNFTHDPATAGQCSNCHNGQKATGKPSSHISTNSQCDTCHRTTGWVPAGFNHANLTGQLCSSCHKGGGPGMPPRSDVVHSNLTGQDCNSCHSSTTTFSTATMNHSGMVAPCSTCHYQGNTVGAVFKPSNHTATTQECNICHSGTTTFANAIFSHSNLAGQACSSCHKVGGPGMAPKNDVVHSNLNGQDCNSCHPSTTSFTNVKMNHFGIVATCVTCHYRGNTVGAKAKPNDHPSTSDDCKACHTTNTFSK
ncbi:MAG: hypothetical protein HY202_06745 [Nitrospirae bacterium]|nr:hypothetical protein [Nitrospirota bacterium]